MNTTATTTVLRMTKLIRAEQEKVFRAWTEPEQLGRWSAPQGMDVAAEVDLQVGGRYRLHMTNSEGEEYIAAGVYRKIEPYSCLSYTWTWEKGDHEIGETLVTVEFVPASDGTEVRLTHELLPSEHSKDMHEQGWASCLTRLEEIFS